MAHELSRKKGSPTLEPTQRGSEFWPTLYSPFGMTRRFADEVDRMFEGFGFPTTRFSPWRWGEWHQFSPEVDIFERDGQLVIRADLPGLNKENVNVDVMEHSVKIEGERKYEHEQHEEGVYSCERGYGHFRREIPLPEGVKADTAKASFKNGILEVTMEVPETAKGRRRIPIEEERAGSKRGETAA